MSGILEVGPRHIATHIASHIHIVNHARFTIWYSSSSTTVWGWEAYIVINFAHYLFYEHILSN